MRRLLMVEGPQVDDMSDERPATDAEDDPDAADGAATAAFDAEDAPDTEDAPDADPGYLTRRSVLAALGLAGLGGCLGVSGEGDPETGASGTPTDTAGSPTDTATATPDGTPAGTATDTPDDPPSETTAAAGDDAVRVLYLYGAVDDDGDRRGESGYDGEPFHQMRLGNTGPLGMSRFRETLVGAGVEIEERYDGDVTLSASSLAPYDVLWLGSSQKRWSATEAGALDAWVRDGGGVVSYSDSAFGGHYEEVGVHNRAGAESRNRLLEQFGMHTFTDQGGGVYHVSDWRIDHLVNATADGPRTLQFRGEGVSPIRITPDWDARREGDRVYQIARHQAGDTGASVTVDDGYSFDPERDCAVCAAEAGDGRVIATFDRNTFWNGGPGTDITEYDHREYARRLVAWTANRADLLGSAESASVARD